MENQDFAQTINKAEGFFDKALAYVDDGSFFRKPINWIYKALGIIGAIIQLVFCVFLISELSNGGLTTGLYIFFVILVLAFIIEIILTLFYWFKRSRSVVNTSEPEDEIFVIPIIAHVVQCLGEIAGLRILIFGAVMFFLPFFLPDTGDFFLQYIILPIAIVVLTVVIAYLTVVFNRWAAESMKAKAITANAAKKVTRQLENK